MNNRSAKVAAWQCSVGSNMAAMFVSPGRVALALGMGLLAGSIAWAEPQVEPRASVEQRANAPAPRAQSPYYIEFRVATIGTYGHSYVAYGRLNAQGQPASTQYADLHPRGNYAVMALGHLLPVPANTKWDPDVLKLPIAATYRRKLSAAQYQKLLAAIQKAKANANPYWNAVTNNCNHFVGELAAAIGLKTPSNFQVSYAFIPALRDLNEEPKATQAPRTPAAR